MASDLDLRLSLGKSVRQTLQTLQANEKLNDRTQNRLVTGKKINNISDGIIDYFRSETLQNRVDLLLERQNEIDQGISSLQTHLTAIESLSDLLGQLRGHVSAARSQPTADERIAFNDDFREIGEQIIHLVNDTEYDGINLLSSDNSLLVIRFSDEEAARIDITGREVLGSNISVGALFSVASLFVASVGEFLFSAIRFPTPATALTTVSVFFEGFSQFSNPEFADYIDEQLVLAERRLEDIERHLGNRTSLLQARKDFTERFSTELLVGAEKITLADLNEETANAKALEIKHEISVASLTSSSRVQQLLLRLVSGQ